MNLKFKKWLIIITVAMLILAAAVIAFISPVTKYLIEKYDEKFTARKIEMDWAYVNPFTGYIYLSGFKLYESKSDSIFFSTGGVSINIALLKLFSKTYEISELTLNQPASTIIQNKKEFNFDDLVKRFVPENPDTTKTPVHFNILNVKVNEGEFYYREDTIGVNYFIRQVDFESSGMRWDIDTVTASFSFLSGPESGSVKGNYTINIKNMDYRFAAVANKFDLKFLEQYLKDMSNYGSFTASMDADIQASGNLNDKENINAKGIMTINDFHFGKNPHDDYVAFDKLVVAIKEVSPKSHIYSYDSISLQHPYFKYERYDHLDNLQNMFGKNGVNVAAVAADPDKFNLIIEIARYVKVLVKNFFISDYKINRAAVYNAHLKFNDYSISEKFSMGLNSLYVLADSIDKTRERVGISFKSGITPYGNVSIDLSINPKDSSDFEMKYDLEKLPSSMFNPYIISYTSFSLDRGTMEIRGSWNVKNGIIKSNNHLLVIDPRTTKRIRNKDTKWVPMPLIMSFVRERGNVIDYEIPIQGNLNDPKFHLRDVIFDLLTNIFVKPPTTPYRMEVKNIETEIEKSLSMNWKMRQNAVLPGQEKFVERMADFLADNPEAEIDIYPKEYAIKEKEYILLFEAKKKYFLLVNNKNASSFNEEDSMKVNRMSAKDSSFVRYLDKQLNDSLLFTIQEKCLRFIGEDILKAKFVQLYKERKENFISYFKEKNVDTRIKIHSGEHIVPYNGFSFYKIEHKGALPESLIKAYGKMSELDEESPRKKYKKERRKK